MIESACNPGPDHKFTTVPKLVDREKAKKGLSQLFLKISAPHSLMTTYSMNLISAGSISLGSIPLNVKPQIVYTPPLLDAFAQKRDFSRFFAMRPTGCR